MAEAAFADGFSDVACNDGTKGTLCASDPPRWNWNASSTQVSGPHSVTKVRLEGRYPVVEDDPIEAHPDGSPCVASPVDHSPYLDTFSAFVKIEGKQVGRVGDTYNGGTTFNHVISTGSGKVKVG